MEYYSYHAGNQGFVKARAPLIKDISEKLNTKYMYGVKSIKNHFFIVEDRDMADSNVLAGNIDGYDYCFVEHYHRRTYGNDRDRWMSKLYMRMKDNFPDFELTTKTSVYGEIGILTFALLFALFFFCGLIITTNWHNLWEIIFKSIFIIFALYVIIPTFYKISVIIFQFLKQGQYGISNKAFRNKYAIMSNSSPTSIKNVFSNDVCTTIAKDPKDFTITFKNSCTSVSFKYNEQLSEELCCEQLKELVRKVKIFEKAFR